MTEVALLLAGCPQNQKFMRVGKTRDTPKETLSLNPSKRRVAQSNEWVVEHKMPTLKTFPKAPSPSSPMISQISSGFSSLRTCSYCFFFFSAPNLNILRKLKNDIVVYSAGKFLKEFNFNRSMDSASVFGWPCVSLVITTMKAFLRPSLAFDTVLDGPLNALSHITGHC